MRIFAADLHVHTCLSPCAEVDMTPKRIMARAVEMGIRLMAITDHNSAENVAVAVAVGAEAGVTVIPGMEIATSEEAHVLALFADVAGALGMQELVYAHLPDGPRRESDYQVVVDADDVVLGFNARCLLGATTMGLAEVVRRVKALGGLVVPSHVDRASFSLTSQFGLVPEGLAVDAFEAVDPAAGRAALALGYPGHAVICSSDAHRLGDVGRRVTELEMEGPTFAELALALRGEGGRRVASAGGGIHPGGAMNPGGAKSSGGGKGPGSAAGL